MSSRNIKDSKYVKMLLLVHKHRFETVVRLLKSSRELEESRILLADAELRELQNPGVTEVILDSAKVIQKRKQEATDELVRIDVLQDKLFSNPGSSSMIDFVGSNLKREV